MSKELNLDSSMTDLMDILVDKNLKLIIEPRFPAQCVMVALISNKDYTSYTTIDLQRYKSAKDDVRGDMISHAVNQVLHMIDQEGLI